MERQRPTQGGADAPARFAAWLRSQCAQHGYDLDARGGQRRFAEAAGIGAATVSRILQGRSTADTRTCARIAATLDLPLPRVLVAAGVLDEDELRAVQNPHTPRRITPEQAADELGIEDEQARRLFVNMTHTLQRTPPPSEDRLADN
ncbi:MULTISPECIES: helix-turn-helix domain-containing protein [Streptomyces]|uniref:helix-turn-helix domain-containing protein n=1 Tax=Streptomyces TaxID=1883 RepID=UPI0005A8D2F5|nr:MULTISPECIES: helix-turn-helix domain-containing protein [Streptomyces]